MAEDDIYGSKKKYKDFVAGMDTLTKKPKEGGKKIYYCKNPENMKYFHKLIKNFESKDQSYIRRIRMFQMLKIITYLAGKDLENCGRNDINSMVAYSHTTHKTVNSKKDFIKDLKCIWRVLFPERDHKGRVDETLTPYLVRHLSRKIDRSKEKLRNDKLSWEEFQKIVNFFVRDCQKIENSYRYR